MATEPVSGFTGDDKTKDEERNKDILVNNSSGKSDICNSSGEAVESDLTDGSNQGDGSKQNVTGDFTSTEPNLNERDNSSQEENGEARTSGGNESVEEYEKQTVNIGENDTEKVVSLNISQGNLETSESASDVRSQEVSSTSIRNISQSDKGDIITSKSEHQPNSEIGINSLEVPSNESYLDIKNENVLHSDDSENVCEAPSKSIKNKITQEHDDVKDIDSDRKVESISKLGRSDLEYIENISSSIKTGEADEGRTNIITSSTEDSDEKHQTELEKGGNNDGETDKSNISDRINSNQDAEADSIENNDAEKLDLSDKAESMEEKVDNICSVKDANDSVSKTVPDNETSYLIDHTDNSKDLVEKGHDEEILDLNEPLDNGESSASADRNAPEATDPDSVEQKNEEDQDSSSEGEEKEDDHEEEEEVEEMETEDIKESNTDQDPESKATEEPDSTKLSSEDVEMKSEASLEEVSDDEDDTELGEIVDNKAGSGDNSGIEEVSDTGELDDSKENSGIEEVSDEEEDMDNEAAENKAVESGVEEVSDEEEEITERKKPDVTEGVEDVSSEEEEIEEEEEEEEEEEDDEEAEEDENEDGGSSRAEDKERTVEVKQNEEVVTYDDTGKEDIVIVKEILETMTIKIENIKTENEKAEKRIKGKEKKERRESTRSKSSHSHKEFKDINERLKAQASYGGEDVELDYDDVHEDGKEKLGSEGELSSDSESDEGECEEEEDVEEGEIKEPGSKPFVKPTCRFFMRGHCTWGANCRFLHPGVNDKGNYQLIERPGFNNKPQNQYEDQVDEQERSPSPEPSPPRAPEPKEETAWERGLRQAKELRKKAMERRELDSNFEHKKFNLSIDDNPEYNKENTIDSERSQVKKYYEKMEPLSDDEYYDQTPVRQQQKQMEQSWMHGHYENFEVRWTRDHHYGSVGHPHSGYAGHPASRDPHYQTDRPYRGPPDRYTSPTLRPSPRFSPSPPPPHYQNRYAAQRQAHMEIRPEKMREKQQQRSLSPPLKRSMTSPQRIRADEWHDPWRRSNVNRPTSPVKRRSGSRGRKRSRRSHSYSSSYSSSSYSSSSSSFSSGSSRSRSRSRSSSRSSKSPHRRQQAGQDRKRRPPGRVSPGRRPSNNSRMSGPPRNAASFHPGRPGRSPDKRQILSSPLKGPKGAPQGRGPPDGRFPHPNAGHGPPGRAMAGRKPDSHRPSPPPQRKFSMKVDVKDRPLPPSALSKDRTKGRRGSSSTSRSRSSSSSSSSSFSSRSSRSSSSSSSGSADSEHLYRNIGGREKPGNSKNRNDKPPRQNPSPSKRPLPMKPSGRPAQIGSGDPPKPKDPLKMMGQKSNIKLTLIKPNDKPPPAAQSAGKKRAAEMPVDVPPSAKRPNISPSAPKPGQEKPLKRPERAAPVAAPSPKVVPRPPAPVSQPPAQPPAATPAVPVKKKSTVSRREELLKQLKAVEDAIAKKKKKMV